MQDLRARLERALSGTHSFERELGGGGMSRTWVAVERAFDRRVVVKVLAPELLAGLSVERFRREVMVAARLQHPHIVPVLASGDADGLPWFAMPYVDGQSLRQRLERGSLPVSEVVSVLRDVARALAYAHAQGIVHRDIKPDNVLLSGGSATVTDFGIAKAIDVALTGDGTRRETLTQAGTSLGTPAYMAPEQAAGDPGADHRADIYSFGAMAYELLAGRPPFDGASPARLLAAHLVETPRDVRELRPDAPAALADLVAACLAKEPDARPADARELLRVLEMVTTSGAAPHVPAVLAGRRVRLGRALGLWAAAAALVVLGAWAATETIGLPGWVVPGAGLVMLLGLPVILLTAFVQRTVHRAYTTTPQRTPGGASSGHGTLATLAIRASPHVSWRRTWLGGAAAVGVFTLLVTGFMVTRALGIGPAASLRGTGEFGERETIVVADFRSPASDSTLGATVAEALRADLAQSRSLEVLTRASMREILGLMERPVESEVPFALAREIATREGAKAVLDGEVVQLGGSYVVSARLASALDGHELAVFREAADSENELIGALGRLSRAVRERAGESLRTIRASIELERVTTPSLPALRKYVEASRLADEAAEFDRAITMLEEAVALDTAFAMAWRKLSVLLNNENRDRPRALHAMTTAYRHRERLTEMERFLTEAYYFSTGPELDLARALAAYEGALALDSTSTAALNNSGIIYLDLRRYDRAADRFRQVTENPRTFGGAFVNLMQAEIRRGRTDSLDAVVEAYRRRLPESQHLRVAEWTAAYARGELPRADSIAREGWERGDVVGLRASAARALASVAAVQGRRREALAWAIRAREAELRVEPTAAGRLAFALDTALITMVLARDTAAARATIARGLARYPLDSIVPADRPWPLLAELAAMTGDGALARQALAGFERGETPLAGDRTGTQAYYRAKIAIAERRWSDALPLLHEADRRFALVEMAAAAEIAQAYDLAGRADSALAWYERYAGQLDETGELDAKWRARVHQRLGELYDARGDRRRAVQHYGRFAELWERADPELQPQVRAARARIALTPDSSSAAAPRTSDVRAAARRGTSP